MSISVTRHSMSLWAACLFAMSGALAADTPASHPTPSKEDREKMAQMHEKMAACLRSDKSVQDCHRDMMKQCRESMGDEACMMMGHGMKPDHMRKSPGKDIPPSS